MDNDELKKIFSSNLNYWLEFRGKTQADLYKMAGVSSATASDWCNSKKLPRTDKIFDIAQWLMIELSDLLTIKERNHNEIDSLIYRIKDDEDFRNTVFDLYNFNLDQYKRAKDYIELLKK